MPQTKSYSFTTPSRTTHGAVIDSSAGGDPLAYIQGHGNLVSGLEKALEGKQDGDNVAVSVPPAEGYGKHELRIDSTGAEALVAGLGRSRKGMQFQARTPEGMRVFTVTGLDGRHGDARRQSSARPTRP